MLNSLNDIASFFSLPYSILFLYSTLVLIRQKRYAKVDYLFLGFLIFIILIGLFYKFLSKRYYILLFFPSILVIGKAFPLIFKGRTLFCGGIPLIAFCFVFFVIKYYNTVTFSSYGFYLTQIHKVTHTDSSNYFFTADNNVDERNRISFYLQKEFVYYPDLLNYNKPDYESTQISSNEPFYYVNKRKTASEYKPFQNLNASSKDFRTVLSFFSDKHHKKKIEIIRADQLSDSFSTSKVPPNLSPQTIIFEDFSNPVSESKTSFFTFDHNRIIDFSPEESRFSNIIIDKKTVNVLRINTKRFLYFYLIRGLSVASSYNVTITLYSYDAGLLLYSMYFYDNRFWYLSNTNYALFILHKSNQPITVSFNVMKDKYFPGSCFCRPYFSFLGDIAVKSIEIASIED